MKRIKGITLFGFTLIELLVVMSIITVLAGLTLSTMSYAQNKAARDRTKTEISAMEVALESYKVDNGDYPRNDLSDAVSTLSKTAGDYTTKNGLPGDAAAVSMLLYTALSADADANRTVSTTERAASRIYFNFKPGMLYPKNSTATVQAVLDPFGNVYGYSTMYNAQIRSSTTGNVTSPQGYNPTCDLWSTNDSTKSGTTSNAIWISNW